MSYITTGTGVHFEPLNPVKEDIHLVDIAHALSLMCRANGHEKRFYSVGQHSIACAMEAKARGESTRVVLGALLHDASESYICDMTRPIKEGLPEYIRVEEELQDLIWERFLGDAVTDEEKQKIFDIDDDMLSLEFHQLMPEDLGDRRKNIVTDVVCAYEDPVAVENRFMGMAEELVTELAADNPELEAVLADMNSAEHGNQASEPLEYKVVRLLIERGFHITCAESCTAGLVASRLVNVPDASKVLDVSFVTYANEAKMKYLNVSEVSIEKFGVVSEQVAGEMALGAASAMGAEVGIGVSGIAGPSGGTPEKPLGTVCFGISICGELSTYTMHFNDSGRNDVRLRSVEFVLNTLVDLLSE